MTDEIYDERENWVEPEEACPTCHESRIDYLVWDEDGAAVTCSSCGTVYVP